MAMKSAWLKGAERVIGLDIEGYRLERARGAAKADIIDMTKGDYIEQLRAMTGGRGPDVCIDAVGMEAHHGLVEKLSNVVHAQVGTISAFKDCVRAVRRGGTISVVGVYGMPYDNFPWGQMFDKGVQVRLGQCPAHVYIDELLAHVAEGRVKLDDVISHRVPLEKAGDAYAVFNEKKDGCVKVVLKP